MSLYFTSKISGDGGRPVPDQMQCHSVHPLVATGWVQNKVSVHTEEGERLAFIARTSAPTALSWHPTKKLLVIGWRDGQMTTWSDETKETTYPAQNHDALAVLSLTWTAGGQTLLSTSKSCSVVLWTLDTGPGGKLQCLWSCRTEMPATSGLHLCPPAPGAAVLHASPVRRASNPHATPQRSNVSVAQDLDEVQFALVTGTQSVCYVDDSQSVTPLASIDRDQVVSGALWQAARRRLVVISSNLTVNVFHVDLDFKVTSVLKRKISTTATADFSLIRMAWAASNLVAMSCGDGSIRILNVDHEAMYSLTFPDVKGTKSKITSLVTSDVRNVLAASTKEGQVAVWGFIGVNSSTSDDDNDWQHITNVPAENNASVETLRLFSSGALGAILSDGALILQETIRKRRWNGFAQAVQVTPDVIVVETINGSHTIIKSSQKVREIDLAFPQVSLWTGQKWDIYTVNEVTSTAHILHSLEYGQRVSAIHPDGIFRFREGRIVFDNYQLQNQAHLSFADNEGTPTMLDVFADFLVTVTNKNIMKVARVQARELRPIGPPRPLFQDATEAMFIVRARINTKGKKVALMVEVGVRRRPDTRVWVYDLDHDHLTNHDFGYEGVPEAICWNVPLQGTQTVGEFEALLLACETRGKGKPTTSGANNNNLLGNDGKDSVENQQADDDDGDNDDGVAGEKVFHNISTLFASPKGVVLHHTVPLKRDQICLTGCSVPYLTVCSTNSANPEAKNFVLQKVKLRDFEGMQAENDPKLREAMMQFAYFATTGNMDEAYRAVKSVKDANVWSNLAKLCVVTRRLDVAEVCLANMNDGVAARALRESKCEPEIETRLALLAVCLGMFDHAEKLLKKAKRADVLTDMLIASNKWEAALKHAETNDRIRIHPVLYRTAQHHETLGMFDKAIDFFQRSRSYGVDVPRMLMSVNRVEELRDMVAKKEDSNAKPQQQELVLWWAQYQESLHDTANALKTYEMAKDYFNVVRILCTQSQPDIDRAVEIVTDPQNKAFVGAAYFIGRYHEDKGHTSKALQFFNLASAYKRALRMAKANDMFNEIVGIVLRANDKAMSIESAHFFADRGMFDKAVQLYQKGGDMQRAIDTCIKGGLFDVLHQISETLDQQHSDPETFIQMAEHFINSQHFDKAVQMLIFAKAYNEALQLCIDKNVALTEEMAEAMTLPKTENDEDESYRISLLKKIAKVAKTQASWHLACKKYTQAGERVKALKMLLSAGDTEKVIFFANHSRNNEIYVLAANYLQSQKWQSDPNIYKSIVAFYTKAKTFESLAGFYDSCAQLQIDEYRDYDKALATMKETQKTLDKADSATTAARRANFAQRIQVVESFVSARKLVKPGQPCPEMVDICSGLLHRSRPENPDHELIDSSVRTGDVFALLVEYYDKLGQHENAYTLLVRMREQMIELTYYLEPTMLERICTQLSRDPAPLLAPLPGGNNNQQQRGGNEREDDVPFVEEDVQ